MGQSSSPTGKRAEVIRRAFLLYHGGRIDRATLSRVIRQFRR